MPLLLCCVLFSEGMLTSLKVSLQRGINTHSVQCIVPIHNIMDNHSRDERPSISHTTLHIVPCPPSPLSPPPHLPHHMPRCNTTAALTALLHRVSEVQAASGWPLPLSQHPPGTGPAPHAQQRTVHTLTEVSPRPVHKGLGPSQRICVSSSGSDSVAQS